MARYWHEFLYAHVLFVRYSAQSSFTHQRCEHKQEVSAKPL